MSKRLTIGWDKWFYSLGVAVIAGVSQSGLAWLGMAGANAAGVDVPQLNFKALGIMLAVACLSNLFTFLKQSPLPPAEEVEDEKSTDKTITTP
jgi:hypothetical protein